MERHMSLKKKKIIWGKYKNMYYFHFEYEVKYYNYLQV